MKREKNRYSSIKKKYNYKINKLLDELKTRLDDEDYKRIKDFLKRVVEVCYDRGYEEGYKGGIWSYKHDLKFYYKNKHIYGAIEREEDDEEEQWFKDMFYREDSLEATLEEFLIMWGYLDKDWLRGIFVRDGYDSVFDEDYIHDEKRFKYEEDEEE